MRQAQTLATVHEYTQRFYDGELAALHRSFSAELKRAMPLERLRALHAGMLEEWGREVEVLGQDAQARGEHRGFVRWARFDRHDGVIELQWILEEDDTIAALFIRPAEGGAP